VSIEVWICRILKSTAAAAVLSGRLMDRSHTVRNARAAAYTKVGVGYNAQIAVDAIVEQAVSNDVLDMGLLQQTAEPARQILEVEKIDVVADKGYFRTEDIAACEKAGLMPMCQSHNVDPQWQAVSSVRTSFATTPRKTPMFVLAGMNSNQSARAACVI
jgi:hypothetical protein